MEGRRSWEFVAIPTVLVMFGILAIIMWAADAGVWAWLAVGAVGLVALVVASLVSMRKPHHPGARPPTPARVDDDVRRVLLVADDVCGLTSLRPAFGDSGSTVVHVVAPALGSRTARWTGDDHAYRDAQQHLDATLQAFSSLGVEAHGHIGPHDPLQAADDGLREFPADEIVFAVHDGGDVNWLEDGVVDTARARYSIPVRDIPVARGEA